ncbi:hypothetical protein LAZ67_23000621 [Cordylochernes scorpioides]|uniref:Transposase n=1 Tax=Cordylochernes scorpioides TaxID=51811 RepID=A0ABY6LU14_9ARAC|nr:hypothetical protein LAZ67_23000621 [Cordylochernes scorpioides]
MAMPTKLSRTNLSFIESVQDGSQNNSHTLGHMPKHLDCYGDQLGKFLNRIVTGDETCIHHYEPETEWHSMEWKQLNSSCKKKFKSQPYAGKRMLTVFGIHKANIQFEANVEDGCQKILCCCCTTTRLHTAAHTVQILQKLNLEILAYLLYSPDLISSDFHLFDSLKEALRAVDLPRMKH